MHQLFKCHEPLRFETGSLWAFWGQSSSPYQLVIVCVVELVIGMHFRFVVLGQVIECQLDYSQIALDLLSTHFVPTGLQVVSALVDSDTGGVDYIHKLDSGAYLSYSGERKKLAVLMLSLHKIPVQWFPLFAFMCPENYCDLWGSAQVQNMRSNPPNYF